VSPAVAVSLSGTVNAFDLVMNQDTLAFLAWIWAHNPVIIVLLAGIPALFSLVVIDTHRHRKNQHRRRDLGNHHP
jgi:hypothetical protein